MLMKQAQAAFKSDLQSTVHVDIMGAIIMKVRLTHQAGKRRSIVRIGETACSE